MMDRRFLFSLYVDDEMLSFFSVKDFFFLSNRRKLFLSTVIKTRQNFKRYTVHLFDPYNKNQ